MPDAVVIGGGAAGIAAARTLRDGGADVLLLEAGGWLGGRAHTAVLDGMPLDLGCGWLHSAGRNPFVAEADALGFTVDRTPPGWDTQWRDLGFPPDQLAALGAAYERFDARGLELAREAEDRPLADAVVDEAWRPALDNIAGYVSGAPMADVSLHDWAAYERAGTDENWRVREGYGALIARLGDGLPVRLGTPVRRVDNGGLRLRIDTDAGTLDARVAVVAVPTTVLASGAMAFTPELPDKQEAAAQLPLGLANKIFVRILDGAEELEPEAHLRGDPRRADTVSFKLRPFGLPMIEAFFGGAHAEALERDGAAGPVIDELVGVLGSAWRDRLEPLAETRWRSAPFIGGAYSYARVGCRGARARLAEAVDGRLFFAGEATSRCDFTTAHGAWATGLAAGRDALAALGLDGNGR